MPSKYANIVPNLPQLPVEDETRQSKVEDEKAKIVIDYSNEGKEITAALLADDYKLIRADCDQLEQELHDHYLRLEAVTQLLVETYEEGDDAWGAYGAEETTLRLPSGHAIRVQKEPHAIVKDKDANRRWAINEGLENMLILPWGTVNSITKQRLLNGEPEPPGVETFQKVKLVFTGPKKR